MMLRTSSSQYFTLAMDIRYSSSRNIANHGLLGLVNPEVIPEAKVSVLRLASSSIKVLWSIFEPWFGVVV